MVTRSTPPLVPGPFSHTMAMHPETRLTVSLLAVFALYVGVTVVGPTLGFVISVLAVATTGEAGLAILTLIRQEANSND